MPAKITSKNQITIPKKIMDQMPDIDYFDIEIKDGSIILKPLKTYETNLAQIRDKMKKLGLKEDCIKKAIQWARSNRSER